MTRIGKKLAAVFLTVAMIITLMPLMSQAAYAEGETYYTVTFDSDGGTPVPSQSVLEGSAPTYPTSPTKEGYTFYRWMKDGEIIESFSKLEITEDTTLTALWATKVTARLSGETSEDRAGYLGKSTDLDTDPSYYDDKTSSITSFLNEKGAHSVYFWAKPKEGYLFEGWYNTSDGTFYSADNPICGTYGGEQFNVTARFIEDANPIYTVSFDSCGGSVVDSQQVAKDEKAVEPDNPTRASYIFVGWYSDKEYNTPFDFDTPITKTTTLYAKWEADPDAPTITVTFDSDGGTPVPSQSVLEGSAPTYPTPPTKEGYTFYRWMKDGEIIESFSKLEITEDTTLTALWATKVTARLSGETSEDRAGYLGKSTDLDTDPSYYDDKTSSITSFLNEKGVHSVYFWAKPKEGYLFEGWYNTSDSTFYTTDNPICGTYGGEQFNVTARFARIIDEDAVSVSATKVYTSSAIKPAPTVTVDDKILVKGTDYNVAYKNNINVGTATVTITGIGNYTGTVEKTFTITPKKITPAVTLSTSAYTWNGQIKKPTVTVKSGSTKLTTSQYVVTYPSGRKNVGTYTITVKPAAKGNYTWTAKKVTFKINPKGTTLLKSSKYTVGKTAVTVKWNKQDAKMSSSRITGYQIQLATNSGFTKNKKLVKVTGYSKVSKKITGLKSGKKYYVRIRTYKTIDGTPYYSPWSAVKTVTTKK